MYELFVIIVTKTHDSDDTRTHQDLTERFCWMRPRQKRDFNFKDRGVPTLIEALDS